MTAIFIGLDVQAKTIDDHRAFLYYKYPYNELDLELRGYGPTATIAALDAMSRFFTVLEEDENETKE